MRGQARGRLGATSGPPPRGPWVPGRGGCGAFSGAFFRRYAARPLRARPLRARPLRGRALRWAGSPRAGSPRLSLGASSRLLAWPLPRPLGPRSGGSGRGRGYAPAAGVFVLFARHSAGRLAGGNPAGAFACGSVGGGVPRPFAAARRPCAPRKFALPACVPACGCRPRGAPCSVAPPLGGSALARRALAVGIVARAATAAGLLAALMLGRPPLRGESGRGYRRLFCAPYGRACGAVGPPARSRPLRSAGRLRRPRGALPSRPTRRALRLPGCAGGCRSLKGPSAARPSARWVADERLTPSAGLQGWLNYLKAR